MIEERIKSLITERTLEAPKKEVSKKLLFIARTLGRPIIEQAVPYRDLENFWDVEAPAVLDSGGEDIHLLGYYFDGLRSGGNLCIKVVAYDGQVAELTCTYNGYRVFTEADGELQSYAPFPSWEQAMDRFYRAAGPVDETNTRRRRAEKKERDGKKALSILDKLRLLWGY